jgi:hypothetical protein
MLNDKLVEVKKLELEYDVKNKSNDMIIINTFTLISALKCNKGRPYKALNVIIFL